MDADGLSVDELDNNVLSLEDNLTEGEVLRLFFLTPNQVQEEKEEPR